jgi:hypothetical protein
MGDLEGGEEQKGVEHVEDSVEGTVPADAGAVRPCRSTGVLQVPLKARAEFEDICRQSLGTAIDSIGHRRYHRERSSLKNAVSCAWYLKYAVICAWYLKNA